MLAHASRILEQDLDKALVFDKISRILDKISRIIDISSKTRLGLAAAVQQQLSLWPMLTTRRTKTRINGGRRISKP